MHVSVQKSRPFDPLVKSVCTKGIEARLARSYCGPCARSALGTRVYLVGEGSRLVICSSACETGAVAAAHIQGTGNPTVHGALQLIITTQVALQSKAYRDCAKVVRSRGTDARRCQPGRHSRFHSVRGTAAFSGRRVAPRALLCVWHRQRPRQTQNVEQYGALLHGDHPTGPHAIPPRGA